MSLTVTVLGCSGSYPGPGQACSGYLVRSARTTLWLDAGSGTLANLQRHVALDRVDAVVLSHEHPDHWTDVEGFAVASHYDLHLPPVDVYAAPGIGGRLQMPLDAFRWNEVADGDSVTVGDLSLTFSRTDHGPVTLAVRVDGPERALGYSADTGPAWSLEALGPGLHLALCEATYLRTEEGGAQHMSARQAGSDARQAGLPRLVLTHRMPRVDPRASFEEGSEAFGSPVELAEQGWVIEL
ncbi:MAG TPA: MBL fold metallo-hydrolase [Acidimicrobiales bacterium]|nr:MBL fold metallo-hydrolase [Acidimicrobiales bacterium]